jgi:SAM-dependent methyltransferase
MNIDKLVRIIKFLVPPMNEKIASVIYEKLLPNLDDEFHKLSLSGQALQKLIKDYSFETVLDIGSGAGEHAKILSQFQKKVTALDFGTSIYAKEKDRDYDEIEHIYMDFFDYEPRQKFDCVWASHVLEHQGNPGLFINKCMQIVKDDGIIAITVPPMEQYVLGGHLTNWNAGILLYHLVFNGIDCRDCSIMSYGYNISVIVRNRKRPHVDLTYDNGDIIKLLQYFPECINREPFEGKIRNWNW